MGIPRVLNLWSTHQFWIGFLGALGIDARQIEFSSDSSEDQARQFAKGRGTVDCCYPVKCVSGHYGELLARDRRHKIDVLLSPMISSLPSYLDGHVVGVAGLPARDGRAREHQSGIPEGAGRLRGPRRALRRAAGRAW